MRKPTSIVSIALFYTFMLAATGCGGSSGGSASDAADHTTTSPFTTLTGNAETSSSAPLIGATVSVYTFENSAKGTLLASGTTDANGAYSITYSGYYGPVLAEAFVGQTGRSNGLAGDATLAASCSAGSACFINVFSTLVVASEEEGLDHDAAVARVATALGIPASSIETVLTGGSTTATEAFVAQLIASAGSVDAALADVTSAAGEIATGGATVNGHVTAGSQSAVGTLNPDGSDSSSPTPTPSPTSAPVYGCNNNGATNYDPTVTVYVPGSCTWPTAPTNGVCGTAGGKTYAVGDTVYGADTFCAAGSANPATPVFPAQGGTSNWSCVGFDGGTTATCSATRNAPTPVNGACGTASGKTYLDTDTVYGADTFCAAGSVNPVSPAFPALTATTNWSCDGLNGGTNATCSASRTGDPTPPTTTVALAEVSKTSSSWRGSATISENGTGYCTALASGAAAPTAAEVKANSNANKVGAGGSVAMAANTTATCAVTGLTAGTAYDFYFVAEDTAGNLQTAPTGPVTATSPLRWTARTSGAATELLSLNWSGAQFVAGSTSGNFYTSPDGVTWTARATGGTEWYMDIVWSGTTYVAVSTNALIRTSPDGVAWTSRTSNAPLYLGFVKSLFGGVAWSGTTFVTVGTYGTIVTSPYGVTWTAQTSGTVEGLTDVAWSGAQFVAVGYNGTILTSPDGVTWTAQTSGTANGLYGVIWAGTEFVAVGQAGTVLTSPDGIVWTARTPATTQILEDVAWSGTEFVAVGRGGAIVTSSDGVTWTASVSGTRRQLDAVVWSGTEFVIAGALGRILAGS